MGGTGGGPNAEMVVGLVSVSLVGAEREAMAADGGADATDDSDNLDDWDDDGAEAALVGIDERTNRGAV